MRTQRVIFLSLVVAVAAACTEADLPRLDKQVQKLIGGTRAGRQVMVNRPRVEPSRGGSLASATEMAAALDLPGNMVTEARLTSPDPLAARVLTEYGVIRPLKGNSLVVMSTGLISLDHLPEPGSDLLDPGASDDVVTLQLTLDVPPGANRMSFDYNFLSAESPDYHGSEYNDEFTAEVTDARGTRLAAKSSVNSSFFFDVSETHAKDTGFDNLMADDPAGVDVFPGNYPPEIPLFPDAGITGFQMVNVEVVGGGPLVLKFDIRDLGDSALDSTVVIDNIVFSSIEVVDPNPGLIDRSQGTVMTDPALLAVNGRHVGSVAADGVTQVLLRARVPGPGWMRLSLPDAPASKVGGVSAVGQAERSNSVTVDVQHVAQGQYYAFALYTSPEDFDTGADSEVATRTVRITTEYTPAIGDGFEDHYELTIGRPPVVAVHDIWSDCGFWNIARNRLANGEERRFTMTCADYAGTNSDSLERNKWVVQGFVSEAVSEMRGAGAAVTQADVIAHGMGGLLARKYIDRHDEPVQDDNYRRFDNFYAGDINRLITMNTPHVGTRMANRIVEMRKEFMQCRPEDWQGIEQLLSSQGISIGGTGETAAIEDLMTHSTAISSIGETRVPSHLMVGTGGRDVMRTAPPGSPPDFPDSKKFLLNKIDKLYMQVEMHHPATSVDWQERRKLILGPESRFFCSDEHDLFVAEADQKGGVAEQAISYFDVDASSYDTDHFRVPYNDQHISKLVDLLNSPINGGRFAPFIPRPSDVERVNSCVVDAPSGPTCAGTELQSAGGLKSADALSLGTLRIVSPGEGTPVSPGYSVQVVMEASGGFMPKVVIIAGAGESVVLPAPPFVAAFPIPARAIGTVELVAFGIDAQDEMRISDPVVLPVALSAKLTSIEVLNGDSFHRRPGSTRQLQVLGHYDDGVTRNISSPSLGTVYSSSNPNVATVTSDGIVTGTGPGRATVVVRNGAIFTSITVTVGDTIPDRCIEVRLGDYNLFVLEDYTQGHDVQGRVAAGGNITLQDFSVGAVLPDTDTGHVLVAGGGITLSRGGVWGDVWYGGQLASDSSVTIWRGTASHGTPIDFVARGNALRTLSSDLASLPTNGTTTLDPWGGILLRGTAPSVNVFHVDANSLTGARHLFIEAPASSFAVINIRGTSAAFSSLGQSFGGGIDEHGVLFNFPDATILTASGYGFFGTVLAPQAHVYFDNGSWDGGIYARALTGNAEGHIRRLRDIDICR